MNIRESEVRLSVVQSLLHAKPDLAGLSLSISNAPSNRLRSRLPSSFISQLLYR